MSTRIISVSVIRKAFSGTAKNPTAAKSLPLIQSRCFARPPKRRGPPTSTSRSAVVAKPNIDDSWQEVVDPSTQQVYWWNTVTNETTPLGAPKPMAQANQAGLANVPPPSAPTVPPPQQQGSMMGGLAGVVAEGFAFGVGSSLARAAVGSIFGGSSGGGGSQDNDSEGEGFDL